MIPGPDTTFDRESATKLALYSFLILFLELALIRYIPAYVRVFGFYINLVLMATFLGMGVGLLNRQHAARLAWLGPAAFIVLLAMVKIFANVIVTSPPDQNEYLWSVLYEVSPTVKRIGITPVVGVLFSLAALVFLSLSALLGREFVKFRALTAYSLDIIGSLAGIAAFGALSILRAPPYVWFLSAILLWAVVALPQRRYALVLAASAVASAALARWTAGPLPEYWSPYYRINVLEQESRYAVNVNGSFHQYMLDFSDEAAAKHPYIRGVIQDYQRPFTLKPDIDTALVLGAGTGNDIVQLLARGVKYIDAVEIDPVIRDLGVQLHFQRPYDDPRVHSIIDDARAFLRKTSRKYDVIVFGTLDSQTLLSGMTSLRLDNYVYTKESFEAAKSRLKPDGLLVTYHMSPYRYIASKIYHLLDDTFNGPPAVNFDPDHRLFNYTFAAGTPNTIGRTQEVHPRITAPAVVPTDDWPYLYVRHHTIPRHYINVLLVVLVITALFMLAGARRQMKGGIDIPMFFMGTGFLLLETKSVTEMSLLFGSTWVVNMLVFASILVMILFANYVTAKQRDVDLNLLFGGLTASLLAAFMIPVRDLLWLNNMGQWILGGLMVALPIFFAAMIFAALLKSRPQPARALAYNLLGAVIGGVLEYSSMLFGVKALYLMALVAYLIVYLLARPRSAGAPSAGAESTAA